jgi:2-polyprenyl-3-methyl-5-hydroxy-6-metoxy-1,4-benzoquinol methylase
MDEQRVRERFVIDDSVVSCLPNVDRNVTAQRRYSEWKQSIGGAERLGTEYLVPRIRKQIEAQWPPPFTSRRRRHRDMSHEELRARVENLGPWMTPFPLAEGITTMSEGTAKNAAAYRMAFRRELICGTVADLLGSDAAETRVLDIGCNNGLFSLDLSDRGVGHVHGIDLRASNIAQAMFLRDHYGIDNVEFTVSDADDLGTQDQWDVVLNLGVLYHVVNPLQFIRQTYELCRDFAIIDTVVHHEPVSAYFLFGDKDVALPEEGRENYEFHPTYRAAIDTINYAGFRDVFEIVGESKTPHGLYANGTRRCFLAIK